MDSRFSINVYGASHAHGVASFFGRFERIVPPEERYIAGNGPVRILVENGMRLKVPKVVKA